jgi:integrase
LFDIEKEATSFKKNRGSSLAPETKKMKERILKVFEEFCQKKYNESSKQIISKLKSANNFEAGYNLLKSFKEYEETREFKTRHKIKPKNTPIRHGLSLATIKVRCHFVRKYLHINGINLDDKDKIKDIFGKIPKYNREAVTHEEIEKVLLACNHNIRALILIQLSSGMRVGEMLSLRVKDVIKNERYQINIRAEISKTKTERITFVSKEAEPYLEFYIKDKEPEELIFQLSKSGYMKSLSIGVDRAGLEKRYEHSRQRTISSHSFRAFFITQLGKTDNFIGHALAGHDHYMKQYDRYTVNELLEKYMECEFNLQIFNKLNQKKTREMERKIDEQQKNIEKLTKMVEIIQKTREIPL